MRWIFLAGTFLTAIPAIGRAQSTADARAELDRLLPEWRAAREAAADGERLRRRDAGATLVERGHLRVMADSAIVGRVASAAATASASLDRVFGTEAAMLTGYPLVALLHGVVQNGDSTHVIRVRLPEPLAGARPGAGRIGSQERVISLRDPHAVDGDLVRALEAAASLPLHAALDDDLRLWLRSALSATPQSQETLEGAYVDLATASTDISRRCLAGDVLGCRKALGLTPADDPVMEGYTAAQRRMVVQGNVALLRTPGRAAEFDRCVVDSEDTACIARLRELSIERLASSYSPTVLRRGFAHWAMAQGGAGAYSRLRASAGLPIAERFALAAGMPADSLVARWHGHLMTGRPTTPSIPPLTAVATLFWIGACGALSLRSSRWR